jgi:CDP-glycerol glycerophosphotransferase (TagB/SpsB family)
VVVDSVAMEASFRQSLGLAVRLSPSTPLAIASIHLAERTVRMELEEDLPRWASLYLAQGKGRRRIKAQVRGNQVVFTIPPPASPTQRPMVRPTFQDVRGTARRCLLTSRTRVTADPRARLALLVGSGSEPLLVEAARHVIVDDIRCQGTDIIIDITTPGTPSGRLVASLANARHRSAEAEATIRNGRATITLNTLATDTNPAFEPTIIPAGRYRLALDYDSGDGARHPRAPSLSDRLEPTLPNRELGDQDLRIGIWRAPARRFTITLTSRGPVAQWTARVRRGLIAAHQATPTQALTPTLYLECLGGDQVADSQLEIARVAARDYPNLTVVWGIKDRSVRVPLGQSSVFVKSPEHFEVLGSAALLCSNHEYPEYYFKRPGQIVVQTYHGHPFKMMGHSRWDALGFTDVERRRGLEWRSNWDLLISQSPLASQLYRENYPLNYDILELGYPRNDPLALCDDAMTAQVRAALGVPEGNVAVLYAPTWRNYLTNNPWRSEMVTFVEAEDLAQRLGPGYTVLWRGHPSHGRSRYIPVQGSGVIDLTYHPDINDLIIASDVGVFDYSSIRFDYAVTGKPMVYFVPDKEQFFESAPALFPFEDSLVGREVTDIDSLVEAIGSAEADLAGMGAQYAAFRQRFCPRDDGHAAERCLAAMVERSEFLA